MSRPVPVRLPYSGCHTPAIFLELCQLILVLNVFVRICDLKLFYIHFIYNAVPLYLCMSSYRMGGASRCPGHSGHHRPHDWVGHWDNVGLLCFAFCLSLCVKKSDWIIIHISTSKAVSNLLIGQISAHYLEFERRIYILSLENYLCLDFALSKKW